MRGKLERNKPKHIEDGENTARPGGETQHAACREVQFGAVEHQMQRTRGGMREAGRGKTMTGVASHIKQHGL